MNKLRQTWAGVLRNIRQTWRQLVLVHLVFTALGFVLFSPLAGLIGWLLLALSGKPALDDQDIVYFLLSPLGMLSLILMAALLIVILAVEQAAFMRLAAAVQHRQRINVTNTVSFALAKLGKLFRLIVVLVTRLLMLALPFLAAAAGIIFLLVTEYDINYYLAHKPAEFWWAVILAAVIFIAMVWVLVHKLLAWAMSLPLVLFTDIAPGRSIGQSIRATSGVHGPIFSSLTVWVLLVVFLEVFLLVTLRLLGSLVIPFAGDAISLLVLILGALSLLWILGNFLISAFTASSFAYIIFDYYQHNASATVALPVNGKQPSARPEKLHFSRSTFAQVLVTGVVAAGLMGAWLIDGIPLQDEVLIIAHRGASGKAPENTLAAFHQAIDDQADWIELDVQETADGAIVVFHDSDFMKLAGNSVKVWDATLTEMGAIDIGSWYAPEFSGERVPTLREVLEAVRGKVNVVIELKYYGHDQQLEQRVVDIVEATDMVENTAIMSLKYAALGKVRALRPDWQIGLLSATAIGNLASLDTSFLAVERGMVNGKFIRRAQVQGRQVFVWTINDVISMSRMMSLGVDGIITDEPELARRVLAARADMNILERLLAHTALLFGQPITSRQYRDESP